MPVAIACVLVAGTATVTTLSRCWLLQRGLNAPPGSTVKRVWGLLVALYATVLMTVGAVSILREAIAGRRTNGSQR
jgi:choline-glycine betaine transporter